MHLLKDSQVLSKNVHIRFISIGSSCIWMNKHISKEEYGISCFTPRFCVIRMHIVDPSVIVYVGNQLASLKRILKYRLTAGDILARSVISINQGLIEMDKCELNPQGCIFIITWHIIFAYKLEALDVGAFSAEKCQVSALCIRQGCIKLDFVD